MFKQLDRTLKTVAIVAALSQLAQATPVGNSESRMNVVLIVVDDLGWSDLGYSGSDLYKTPHVDRLAKESVVHGEQSGHADGVRRQRLGHG